MINWFEVFAEKLAAIEEKQNELRTLLTSSANTPSADPYGDFHWLCDTCPGVPASTLRIKSASGEIPGVIKFGKRVLYDKSAVLNWLRSQTRQTVDMIAVEQSADEQITRQLSKWKGAANE